MNKSSQFDITIASGATDSEVFALNGATIMAIQFPATMTSTAFEVKGHKTAADAGVVLAKDSDGLDFGGSVTVSRIIVCSAMRDALASQTLISISLGTAEGAARDLTVFLKAE